MTERSGWTTDDWATPKPVVRLLESTFECTFEIDPCCTRRTRKASTYYTVADNGLKQPWRGAVFLNPPYSNPTPWVRRAARLTSKGRCPLVVALLPCCLDTKWFHDWVLPYAELHFLRGRVQFLGPQGVPVGSPRQPNFIAVYRSGKRNTKYTSYSIALRE